MYREGERADGSRSGGHEEAAAGAAAASGTGSVRGRPGRGKPEGETVPEREIDEAIDEAIDDAIEMTFPASDPPAWMSSGSPPDDREEARSRSERR